MKSLFPSPVQRSDGTTILLARARADTVEAGAGTTRPNRPPGDTTAFTWGPIFGQVVDVERFGGAGEPELEDGFARLGDRRVLIVPWAYDSSCRPARWNGSFRWIAEDEPAAFTVELRPDSLWIDGSQVSREKLHRVLRTIDPVIAGTWALTIAHRGRRNAGEPADRLHGHARHPPRGLCMSWIPATNRGASGGAGSKRLALALSFS